MNEPKRRGRPPKVIAEARYVQVVEAPKRVDLTAEAMSGIGPEDFARPPFVAERYEVSEAQAYALRVWSGQTPDLPRNERLKRVAKALEGQGMSMEGVEL